MKNVFSHGIAAATLAAFLLLGTALFPDEVQAEGGASASTQRCSPVQKVVAHLSQRFQEKIVGRGISSGETLILIFASAAGSWTIAEVDTSGLACLRAAGQGFEVSNDNHNGRSS